MMAGRMTVRDLELFVAVCEEGGVTAAARALGVAQPSVSQAVRALEERFGVRLFDRMPRRMVPTEEGQRLLARARAVLGELEGLERAMEGGGGEVVRVASSITWATRLLPAAAARTRELDPPVSVRARVMDSASVERAVVAGEVDLGLVEGIVRDPRVEAEELTSDELVVVAAGAGGPDVPDELAPAALARLPLLLRERGSGVRDLFDAAMLSRGIACEPTWESVSTEALVEAVRHGLGVSVLPLALVAEHVASGALRLVRVRGVDLGRSLLAIRHRGRELTPGRVALLEALRGAALGLGRPEAPTTR